MRQHDVSGVSKQPWLVPEPGLLPLVRDQQAPGFTLTPRSQARNAGQDPQPGPVTGPAQLRDVNERLSTANFAVMHNAAFLQ